MRRALICMRRRAGRRRQGGNAAARRARPAPGCGKVAPTRRAGAARGRGGTSAGAPRAAPARWSEPACFASRCSPGSARRAASPLAAIPPPPQRCPLAPAQLGPVPARGDAGACPPRLPLSVTSPVRKPRGAGAARRRAPESWRLGSARLGGAEGFRPPRRRAGRGPGAAPPAGAAAPRPTPPRRGRCINRNGARPLPQQSRGSPCPEAAAGPGTAVRALPLTAPRHRDSWERPGGGRNLRASRGSCRVSAQQSCGPLL